MLAMVLPASELAAANSDNNPAGTFKLPPSRPPLLLVDILERWLVRPEGTLALYTARCKPAMPGLERGGRDDHISHHVGLSENVLQIAGELVDE